MTQEELIQKLLDMEAELKQLREEKRQAQDTQAKLDSGADISEVDPEIVRSPVSRNPCSQCGTVHENNPNGRIRCKCIYCGNVGLIVLAVSDAKLGIGGACDTCVSGQPITGQQYWDDAAQDATYREAMRAGVPHEGLKVPLPWETLK